MSSVSTIRVKISRYFPALDNVNFRSFWRSQCIALIGIWMQTTAQAWLVFSLTDSSFFLGLSVAAGAIPILVLSPFVGVFIDRYSEKKALLLSQAVVMALAFVVATLLWLNTVRFWHIMLISLFSGIANAVNFPARQTYICKLLGKEELVNGIALNSVVFNTARIIGPALAGILMRYAGIAVCFFAAGLCFIPVIIRIYTINAGSGKETAVSEVCRDTESVWRYISEKNILLGTLLLSAVIGMLAMNYSVLTPVFAGNVLSKGETGFTLLLSFMGIGSLIGAILMAAKSRKITGRRLLLLCPITISCLFLLLGIVKSSYLAAAIYLVYGFCVTVFATISNATIMLNTADGLRGRVVGIYTLLFTGTNPIGGIISGILAERFGAAACYMILGFVICFLMMIVRRMIHAK